MTPLEIEIMLRAYFSPTPHASAEREEGRAAIRHLKEFGLIDSEGRTTEMGRAHISQLCRLPFPQQGWIDSHGSIIPVVSC